VFAPGRSVWASGREWTVERGRAFKDGWLVKLAGVADKSAADAWRGVALTAPTATLRPPEGNEVYLHELVGMVVRDAVHGELGPVASWYELPQGLVLEVRGATWRADIPFNEAFVTAVDRAARAIAVRLPEGMLERASLE
jgi:16S rRNA processing protein RimM